jgi:RED-like protein N-terminal region
MDNEAFSKLVSSRVSTKAGLGRNAVGSNSVGRKGDDVDDSKDVVEPARSSRRRAAMKQRHGQVHTKKAGKSTKQTGDSTYRDRAKERREGIKPEDEQWPGGAAASTGAVTTEETFVSASDANFDAVINDFETQHPTDRFTSGQIPKSLVNESSSSSSLLAHRVMFATAEQAVQWVNGQLPAVPPPTSETAQRIVEFLRTKPILATPQHLSLHRAYYTFGTQWNPWWERPVMNTFLDPQEKPLWTPLSAQILAQVSDSCQRIAKREAERKRRAAAPQNHDKTQAMAESSDEDDIFAGAGDYDPAVAIKETSSGVEKPALGGTSIFGVVERKHTEPIPTANSDGAGDSVMRRLTGFSETLDVTADIDMYYEVGDADPKKKKKKRRRKKNDDDSD